MIQVTALSGDCDNNDAIVNHCNMGAIHALLAQYTPNPCKHGWREKISEEVARLLRSRNYPPSPALADVIARHYVFSVNAPDDFELVDRLLAETAFIRILIRGDWATEAALGQWTNVGRMVFSGPNARPLTVRVRGGFHVVGIAFCPAGWRTLFDHPANAYTDQMLSLHDLWGDASDRLFAAIAALRDDDDNAVVATIEAHLAALIQSRGGIVVEPAMAEFELIARTDSTIMIRDAATRIGMSSRQLERHCRASFGMSPKTVLRRSRFLDMASAMRGLSQPSEQELTELRYYDQSHRNREFRHFIGMTPGQFAQTPTPLLTAGLELRNLRKAESAASLT